MIQRDCILVMYTVHQCYLHCTPVLPAWTWQWWHSSTVHFPRIPRVNRYQNVSILYFIILQPRRAKLQSKMSSPTNQHPASNRPDALPVTQPTVSKH